MPLSKNNYKPLINNVYVKVLVQLEQMNDRKTSKLVATAVHHALVSHSHQILCQMDLVISFHKEVVDPA